MGLIKLLPDQLINQIAAGEVVERPASVVKELVENAIDAEADRIVVEIAKGGTAFIKVTDNGRGMDKEDAKLMFTRHTTSKISSFDDLHHIHTMGFRGEAVASIASVSRITLKTKAQGALSGTHINFSATKLEKIEDTGCPEGTMFEVKNLFFNTPARQKYLKTEQTEYGHIVSLVSNFALAFPGISFKFVSNERTVFDLPKTEDLLSRVQLVLGQDFAENLMPIFFGGLDLEINGYIGQPHAARGAKTGQYLFVNDRAITNNYLNHAIIDAYDTLIPKGRYPTYVLKIKIDPSLIDVNVHPRKLEVRFVNQQLVYAIVKKAVAAALQRGVQSPKLTQNNPSTDLNDEFLGKETFKPVDFSQINSQNQPFPKKVGQGQTYSARPNQINSPNEYSIRQALNFTRQIAKTTAEFDFDRIDDRPKTNITPRAQIAQSYIIAEDEEGLVILDQHAAHERVMYAALKDNLAKTDVLIQPLLIPFQLELSFKEVQILEANQNILQKLGFEIESFGGNSFSINAVPACINKENVVEVVKGVIDDLLDEKPVKSVAEKQERIINFMACHSAIKFGRTLAPIEQSALIEQLEAIEKKYTCPHGRPTMMKLTFKELEKRFGRT